jgi:hypothetical protein
MRTALERVTKSMRSECCDEADCVQGLRSLHQRQCAVEKAVSVLTRGSETFTREHDTNALFHALYQWRGPHRVAPDDSPFVFTGNLGRQVQSARDSLVWRAIACCLVQSGDVPICGGAREVPWLADVLPGGCVHGERLYSGDATLMLLCRGGRWFVYRMPLYYMRHTTVTRPSVTFAYWADVELLPAVLPDPHAAAMAWLHFGSPLSPDASRDVLRPERIATLRRILDHGVIPDWLRNRARLMGLLSPDDMIEAVLAASCDDGAASRG